MISKELQDEFDKIQGKIDNLQFAIIALNHAIYLLQKAKREETEEILNKYHILTDWEE